MLLDQAAETPIGKPLAPLTPLFVIPDAPVVLWVIFVNTLLEHIVGLELAADVVLLGNCASTLNDELDGDVHAFEFVAMTE